MAIGYLGSRGTGFALGEADNVFDAGTSDRATAEATRDAYGVANTDWLAYYDGNSKANIILMYYNSTDETYEVVYQIRYNDEWLDNTSAVAIRGLAGDEGTTVPATYHVVSDGTDIVASDMIETDTDITTTKDLYANTINVAAATVSIGPALELSAGGNELLQRSQKDTEVDTSIVPSKGYDTTSGTLGLTKSRIIGEATNETLFSYDYLLSDDETAIISPNDTSGKVIYTVDVTEDRFITNYSLRFSEAQSGVRMVVRAASSDGPVIFESEPDHIYAADIGEDVVAYEGTSATETTFDFEESPFVVYEGTTYYITFESNVGDVVMYGGLDDDDSEFKPYVNRDIQSIVADPVVATSIYNIEADFDMDGEVWYANVYVDASGGDVTITLPTATGEDAQGMPIYVTKTDSSSNTVTVEPYTGETISGCSCVTISKQHRTVMVFSDGSNPYCIDLVSNSTTLAAGYFDSTVTTDCADSDTWYKVDATFTTTKESNFTFDSVNNWWIFTGTSADVGIYATFVGGHGDGSTQYVSWKFTKNGEDLEYPDKNPRIESSDTMSITLMVPYLNLVTGDYIELYTNIDETTEDVYTSKMSLLIR